MRVIDNFIFTGSVPKIITTALVQAVETVPDQTFTDLGKPLGSELDVFDHLIQTNLELLIGCPVDRNRRVRSKADYNVDLACPERHLLVEIEKGTQPRLELDLLKFAAAGRRREVWKYGALIVPASRVHLKLSGGRTPFQHLRSLSELVGDVFQKLIDGIVVVGYDDPRE